MKRITSRNNASILQRKAIAAEKLVSLTSAITYYLIDNLIHTSLFMYLIYRNLNLNGQYLH